MDLPIEVDGRIERLKISENHRVEVTVTDDGEVMQIRMDSPQDAAFWLCIRLRRQELGQLVAGEVHGIVVEQGRGSYGLVLSSNDEISERLHPPGLNVNGFMTLPIAAPPPSPAIVGCEVFSMGLRSCSACAPSNWTQQEVESAVRNHFAEKGVAGDWRVSAVACFRTKQPHPCPCEKYPGRLHWLLEL